MSQKNLETILAFLELFHFTGRPDTDKIMGYFAPGGTYQPLVPATPKQVAGADMAAALDRQFSTYYECRCEIHASAATGAFVFTERSDHVTLHADDKQVTSRVCAVFELDSESKIISWREYWDTSDIMNQMGLTAEQLAEKM
jgi:limonene-1,2-epoxide hydrolase